MARIVWKENQVVSIMVRDDLYCLAQMLKSPYMLFFHQFRGSDDWSDVNLNEASTLFFRGVTRQFLKFAKVRKANEISPKSNIDFPRIWLQRGPGSQRLKIWEGTPDEMEVMALGEEGVRVVEKVVSASGVDQKKIISPYLKGPDHEEIDLYEIDSLGVFPETIERLYLCYKFNENVDPEKSLICGRDLPREYRRYFEAVMS